MKNTLVMCLACGVSRVEPLNYLTACHECGNQLDAECYSKSGDIRGLALIADGNALFVWDEVEL